MRTESQAVPISLNVAAAAAASETLQLDGPISAEDISICVHPISYDRIKKMRKEVKNHRSVANINGQEVRFILAETNTN